jgi:hypothetical protein
LNKPLKKREHGLPLYFNAATTAACFLLCAILSSTLFFLGSDYQSHSTQKFWATISRAVPSFIPNMVH